jgi:hypothetical protein
METRIIRSGHLRERLQIAIGPYHFNSAIQPAWKAMKIDLTGEGVKDGRERIDGIVDALRSLQKSLPTLTPEQTGEVGASTAPQ